MRAWLTANRSRLWLAARVTAAAVLSLAAAQVLRLNLPLWAVLTALVVTQIREGRSLRATLDYLVGTLCGAGFGALIAYLVPHAGEAALLAVIAITVAPLALLAAAVPSFAVAPATAIIVILLPAMTHGNSTASALDRIMEVAVGCIVGLAVSLVMPGAKGNPRE